jgi:hypothetical protein
MYWSKRHPDEAPIELPMDFTDNIRWRLRSGDDDDDEGGESFFQRADAAARTMSERCVGVSIFARALPPFARFGTLLGLSSNLSVAIRMLWTGLPITRRRGALRL